MAEENLIKTPDLGQVEAIDFVTQFASSIERLQQALGITRRQALSQGNTVQTYRFDVTKPSGAGEFGLVDEGEDIPLTHVKRADGEAHEIKLRKYRKAVTAEEIQRVGFEMAVNNTDRAVVREVQNDIKRALFESLSTAPTDAGTVSGLQEALGTVWGEVNKVFDTETELVVFVNPIDAGKYLGLSAINNGESVGFGLTLLGDFTGASVLVNNAVPQGEVYGTARDNLISAYIDTTGEISKLFIDKPIYTDETGFIGLVPDDNTTNMTRQSTIYTGYVIFAEVENGVVKVEIGSEEETSEEPEEV